MDNPTTIISQNVINVDIDDVPTRIRDKVKQELIKRGREDFLGGK